MASGKAAGPSGIVAEMLKPIGKLAQSRCVIPLRTSSLRDTFQRFIIHLYNGKGDALNRGNYMKYETMPVFFKGLL